MDELEKMLLMQVADLHRVPDGAYNIRKNGEGDGRRSTDRIRIEDRKDGHAGIDIFIAPNTKNESVHIPVVITKTDYRERVYNDFYIGENADVLIIAGCGIHNCGVETSETHGRAHLPHRQGREGALCRKALRQRRRQRREHHEPRDRHLSGRGLPASRWNRRRSRASTPPTARRLRP